MALRSCESSGCAPAITVHLNATDRKRLQAIRDDGNTPQKHVWRARIVLIDGTMLALDSHEWHQHRSLACIGVIGVFAQFCAQEAFLPSRFGIKSERNNGGAKQRE